MSAANESDHRSEWFGQIHAAQVLLAREDADDGEVRWGANLNIGYYDQQLGRFRSGEHGLRGDLARAGRRRGCRRCGCAGADALPRATWKNRSVCSAAASGACATGPIAARSAQRSRADEPTNHLDIASAEALGRARSNGFEGTVLCVSHDRYFLDRVAKRLFILHPPTMEDFDGSYSKWHNKTIEKTEAIEAAAKNQRSPEKNQSKSEIENPKSRQSLPPPLRQSLHEWPRTTDRRHRGSLG